MNKNGMLLFQYNDTLKIQSAERISAIQIVSFWFFQWIGLIECVRQIMHFAGKNMFFCVIWSYVMNKMPIFIDKHQTLGQLNRNIKNYARILFVIIYIPLKAVTAKFEWSNGIRAIYYRLHSY